jgi:CheY-like chemotaxis protein
MQAETSTTRRFGGTGLGLTICQRLAKMMGGDVKLTSKHGEGTQAIFEFAMPVARALQPQQAIAGKKALLCTRDPMLERELSNTLSALGLNLVGTDVEDLHEFDATDADLFVVDAAMVKAGLVPAGVPCIRLVDTPDPRGSYMDQGTVVLCGNPLLWRSATDACHVALNLPLPDMTRVLTGKTPQRSARILVAEDHAINRAVISRQLDRLGYAHTLVDDGKQAVAALQNDTFDLLLTDCHMPEMDGYALTRNVRERERQAGGAAHLTIIALSASALPEQIQRCRDAGMDDFLAKPMQLSELDAKLAEYLAVPEPAAPVSMPETRSMDGRLTMLMEVFGSMTKVRAILGGLLDASRLDIVDLDNALGAGDVLRQRDLLHRISGSLQLLGDTANDESAVLKDNAQQRHDLVLRLDALELLIADMDSRH